MPFGRKGRTVYNSGKSILSQWNETFLNFLPLYVYNVDLHRDIIDQENVEKLKLANENTEHKD